MRTKEILENQKHGFNSGQKEAALKAMQQYADEFACAFAEWKDTINLFSKESESLYYNFVEKDDEMPYFVKKSNTELLEIFKKEQDGL